MTAPFTVRRQVRFADCDPAGIAYYPRCLELCDGAVEDWCEAILVPRRILHLEMGLALPTVELSAIFAAPCRLGELLDIALTVHSVGRSSVALSTTASCAGAARFDVRYTQVLMSMAAAKAVEWPGDWRARLETLVPVPAEEPR